MSDVAAIDRSAGEELAAIDRELADLFRVDPAGVVLGSDAALGDELVVCGILGGKDVGKSTLINALAGMAVTVDEAEVGRGTDRPLAYVHEAERAAVERRLRGIQRCTPVDVVTHRADATRRVVLVDLPDFDSDFLEHLDVVRRTAPLLDRVLWVLTPRKIGDRAWVAMFGEVIKDARNVHCVVNKVDELLTDADALTADGKNGRAAAFWRAQQRWVAEAAEAAGCRVSEDRRFLVAARYPEAPVFEKRIAHLWDDVGWSRYGGDRAAVAEVARLAAGDMDRLRERVLGALSDGEGLAIKSANRRRELETAATRIENHYDLERTIDALSRACDAEYLAEALGEGIDAEYVAALTAAVDARLRSDAALADELLDARVAAWPLLRLAYWPFGWLSRAMGRRVGGTNRLSSGGRVRGGYDPAGHEDSATDAVDFAGDVFESDAGLRRRVETVRARLLADHAVLVARLGLDRCTPSAAELARAVTAGLSRLPQRLERELMTEIRGRDRRPSLVGRASLWLVLLWFPLVQPVLAGLLEMRAEGGTWRLAHGAYRIVSALSAGHLLAGLGVVAVIYVGILGAMYTRARRAVHAARAESARGSLIARAVDATLLAHALAPMGVPFRTALDRLLACRSRLAPFTTAET